MEAALWYKNTLNFSIVPSKNKQPLISWTEFQSRIPTDEEVKNWWTQNPDAGISVVTGSISGIVVIDCDSPEAINAITNILPDSKIFPCVGTPRAGRHFYFICSEKLQRQVSFKEKTDFLAEGSVVVLPPSKGTNGKEYQWLGGWPTKRDDFLDFSAVSSWVGIREGYTNRERFLGVQQSATDATKRNIFEEGVRDENLFHIAYCLTKTGNCKEYVEQALLALMKSWGEYDPKWVNEKIRSAFKHIDNKNRNLTEEITNWVLQQDGSFSATSCNNEQQLATKSEKSLARMILFRLKKEGIIEKHGGRSGDYRLIDKTVDEIVINDSEEEFLHLPLWLPFELHTMVDISEGNIILIAGEFNSGKTAWLLNILKKNKGKFPIRYMSSEMWRKEFKKRFRGFTDVPASYFNTDESTQYIYRSSNYADALMPGALNIIDYLEMDDYTKTAEILRQIHDKTKGGLCIVAVQKKKGEVLGRGKDMLMEKPRLAISLYSDEGKFTAHITKAKICIGGNHDGKKLDFGIQNGCKLEQLSEWKRGGR